MQRAIMTALAAASLVAGLPTLTLAQAAPPPSVHSPISGHNITDQLDQLSARIERYRARGQLSPAEADAARRAINALEGQAGANREANGGQFSDAERFAMQSKIDDLNRELRRERAANGGAPTP